MNGNLKILFGKTVLNKFKRLIARLDIKGPNLIKGIHLEGLRVIGNPNEYALKYYKGGIDEIIYIDPVASLYERNILTDIIERTCKEVFVPITVGGGIKSLNDVEKILKSGADKVVINSYALEEIEFITEASRNFGSQCIVASVDVKKINNDFFVFNDPNRKLKVFNHIRKLEEAGAGEILITSVDSEGTMDGGNDYLAKTVRELVSVPLIYSGGISSPSNAAKFIESSKVDALGISSIFHFTDYTPDCCRTELAKLGFPVRK